MRKSFFLIIVSIFFFFKYSFAEIENKIIIKVQNQIITNFEVKNKILSTLVINGEEINQFNIDKLKKISINSLIDQKLMKIELQKYNIQTDQTQLNQYLESISSNNIVLLKKKFIENSLDFDLFINDLETQLNWQKFIFSTYSKKINIDEKMIETELEKILSNQKKIVEFNLSEIVINLGNEKYNYETISNIKKEIREKNFDAAVNLYSISASRNNKGNIGWISEKALSKEIYDAVRLLKVGEITQAIKKQDTILFLKLNEKKNLNSNEIDKKKLKEIIINQKKNELFNLYSRSYLSKLKNDNLIEYK